MVSLKAEEADIRPTVLITKPLAVAARLDDADFKRKYAGRDSEAERVATFDAIAAKVKASNCSPDAPPPAPTPG